MPRSSLPAASLAALLFIIPLALAQSSGTINLSSTQACVIVAQIASLSSPKAISAMIPICPDSGDTAIAWPLTTSGDGASSSIAIYAHTAATDGGVSVGCVMGLSQMQAMYLLGRDLRWGDSAGTLYDNTAGGNLLDPTTYATITCGSSDTLLPSGLVLPDPSSNDPGSSVWNQTITLTAGAKASGGNDDSIIGSTIAEVTSVAALASSTFPVTSAAAKTSAAPVTSATPETSAAAETSETPLSTDQLAVQTSSFIPPSPSSSVDEVSQTKAVATSSKPVISEQLNYSDTSSLTAVELSSVSEVVDAPTAPSTFLQAVVSSDSAAPSESDSDQAKFESSGQPVAVQTSSPAPQPISVTVEQVSSTQQETTVEVQTSAQPETSAQPQTSGQPHISAQPKTSDQSQSSAQPSESSYQSESNEQPTSAESPSGNYYSSDNGGFDSTSVIAVQSSASLKAPPSIVQSDAQHVTSYDASTYQATTASLSSSAHATDVAYESSNDDNPSDSEVVPQTSPSDSSSAAPTRASAAIASNTYPISSSSSDSSDGSITVTALDVRPSSMAQASSSQTAFSNAGTSTFFASSFESKISPSGIDGNGSPSETDQSQSQRFELSSSNISIEQVVTPTSSHQPTTYALFTMPASSSSASSDEPFVFTVGGMIIGQFTETGAGAVMAAQISATSTTDQATHAIPAAESSAWYGTAAVENTGDTDATSASVPKTVAPSAVRTRSALADGNAGILVNSANESVSQGTPTGSETAREASDSNLSDEDNYDTYTLASASTSANEVKWTEESKGDISGTAVVDVASTEGGDGMRLTGVPATYVSETQASKETAKKTDKGNTQESGVGENTASVTVGYITTSPTAFGISLNSISSSDSFGRESSDDKHQSLSATSYQANFTITGESAMVSASGHSHHQSGTAVNDMTSQIIAVETSAISSDSSPRSSAYRFSKGNSPYTLSGSPGAEPTSISPWAQALSNNRNSSASFSEVIVTASSFVGGASYSLESGSTEKAVVTGGQSGGKTCARKRKEKARRARALLMEAM
ncbi:cell wall surface anchor protein, variant [Cryptococcus neoformans var. grubii H99]|uniref:Cell wall surface anchor protein, variant n=1 Tax=Cryptococcus neoformans (strain H99 / ATCC 208821 / CBS 10515 / FGSC 9487) TaxID=235443 RepID=T2BPA4_CRYN9|nr:cell wall surface anchor protein, variant [Cryptococcus neoformans var. grubii H99]AGV14536.1 cell wall surface anchor protein, variant [Cryptococcus neoformans var. grubii H99]AUB26382.1 cell wall surface anchor protein [Cryptococcus neoformans var. grubii]|eukprot:XP_012051116.1 cell wall surface anchor protein, variant [Cryptococcus neoformans var. grubii H99]